MVRYCATGLLWAEVHRRGVFRGGEWGGRALSWGALGAAPLHRHPTGSGRVLVNRKSAAPESEAVALFISRQPGSPLPPLSSNSFFLCWQLVRLPSARLAPGADTALGREPRAPGWDGVTLARECTGLGRTGMLDSRFLRQPCTLPGRKDPGAPVTPRPAVVTTMWGFVACGVPARGQVAVVPLGRPGPAWPQGGVAEPCMPQNGAGAPSPRPAATPGAGSHPGKAGAEDLWSY